jgi:hypothetical protein
MFQWLTASVAVFLLCSTAQAGGRTQFEPLRLNGEFVRWFPQSDGKILLRYAIADREAITPEATNCRKMRSPSDVLAKADVSPQRFSRMLRDAFDIWERVAALHFVETSDTANADILIGAQSEPVGYAFTSVLRGERMQDGFREIRKAAICFNPERAWKDGRGGDLHVYDLSYTLTHEIGHVIGLDHPSRSGHLMSFRYSEDLTGLTEGDIAGANFVYGPAKPIERVRASLP